MRKKIITVLIVILFISGLFLIYLYSPLIGVELKYQLNKNKQTHILNKIVAADDYFSVVIPKINANSKVIENVDPFNPQEYQRALTQGVAHAKGSSLPSEPGSTFLFSHSSVNILEAIKYNSQFYLLSKLKKGDNIYLIYKERKYLYKVNELKIVNANEVSYLNYKSDTKKLILMTCYPAGTDFKRQLVIADLDKTL